MAESVSNDRAIEVIAEWLDDEDAALAIVEALAGAGLQITDLTPEQAQALLENENRQARILRGEGWQPPDPTAQARLLEAWAVLRRLSGATDA